MISAAPAARWSLWSTTAFLATDDPRRLPEAERLAREMLADVDRACSRFRSDSDLVRANARPGRWVAVDPLLVAATRVAVEAARVSAGLVDPCLGRHLVAVGYDADLAVLRARAPDSFQVPAARHVRPDAWLEVGLGEGAIRVPPGTALDLGATAKAWAADLVCTGLVEALGTRVVLGLGGDLRILAPAGSRGSASWPVEVSELPGDADPEPVWVDGGGVATSSTLARRWSTAAGEQHHLLDPRTGRPCTGPWRTVTATGPTCVAANTACTAALVLGDGAVPWLESRGVTARLVARSGAVHRVGGWPAAPGRA